jgi:diguanylate cyclase (GGDEF)-like protein/PAS domain S-box-containing protein
MASRLNELSAQDIDHIERSRERARRSAERRELVTELSVCLVLAIATAAMAFLFPPGSVNWLQVAALVALGALLVQIEFEVGEGHTRPVQLAFVPMLLLLPPALLPVAIVLTHLPATLLKVLRGRATPQRMLLPIADSSFALAPAVVMAVAGSGQTIPEQAMACAVALVALIASDFAVSVFRMRVGLGMDPRAELRGFAWVYLVDMCLAPIGFLAGIAAREYPGLLIAVLPLAGLLAVFARERRGRIANALALQQLAQEGRDRLQSIVQNASDCILIVAPDAAIKTLTGSVEAIFGPVWEEAHGTMLLERVHPQDAAIVNAFLDAVSTKAPDEPQEAQWRMRYADGSDRHVEAVATNLLDDARVAGIVITMRDVEERKAFEEQLRHRAFHDALTGLANRALFYDRVEHALGRAAREASQVAVLFVDLDDFKTINDVRGHTDGDRLLQELARRLSGCLRAADTAARLGGDEFGVLLEGIDEDGLAATADRVLEALSHPAELSPGHVTVSASIGMALSTDEDRGVEQFLRKADLAMYQAKRNGKRRAELYHPALENLASLNGSGGQWFARDDEQRAEIENILRDPDALHIVFQPIMDLRTGRVAGYESLSRFNREPRRPPNLWFAQAHRCGLGYALEAHAIALALATPGRPHGTYLTFNLSPSSLLSDEVLRVLPHRLDGLVVEITENELVSGDPQILHALDDLRARGARLAVDDTGAGYAGLTHVMRLQPDIIKLDRALTTSVDTDPAKAPLISSFVRYARDINADVCAEGVETLAELERLADLDVAYGQGYGIARPSPPWADATPDASTACLRAFKATLADTRTGSPAADHDRRLELLAGRLAAVTNQQELQACLGPLARELGADEIRINGPIRHDAEQTLVDDPDADPAEIAALREAGYRSRLVLPIRHGDRVVACLEAYSQHQRPWSRFQVGRARLISYQLTSLSRRDAGEPWTGTALPIVGGLLVDLAQTDRDQPTQLTVVETPCRPQESRSPGSVSG